MPVSSVPEGSGPPCGKDGNEGKCIKRFWPSQKNPHCTSGFNLSKLDVACHGMMTIMCEPGLTLTRCLGNGGITLGISAILEKVKDVVQILV